MYKQLLAYGTLWTLLIGTAQAQEGGKAFEGLFANDAITLRLHIDGGAYAGQVQFDGQSFPVAARLAGGMMLQGTYTYQGQALPFEASLQGETLTILAEGQRYRLTRQAAATSTGQAEAAAGTFSDPDWGIRFMPPEGWERRQVPAGYLFASNTHRGFILVMPHEAATLDQLRAEAEQGLAEGSGTLLRAEGAITPFGDNGLAADFGGTLEGQSVRARVIGLVSPHGRGATILAAVEPTGYAPDFVARAEALARSVVFTAPATQAAVASGDSEVREWAEWFQGCRLSYFNRYNSGYGGGGYSDETVIDLCPGYFTYGDHSETVFNTQDLSGSDVYRAGGSQGAGQWTVVRQGGQPALQLRFHDGSVRSYALSYEDGKTFLDGRRWLRTCNPNDQVVEARPQCH